MIISYIINFKYLHLDNLIEIEQFQSKAFNYGMLNQNLEFYN